MSLEEKYQIPKELGEIVNELVEGVLRNNPTDIEQWCYDYFNSKIPLQIEEQEQNEIQEGTFYCYFTLKELPHINHHYYILAFLSNDPFHVTKTIPMQYEESCSSLYFNELHKFFLKVDDSILEQCLVLQVYDLERSKECISELNMDLFHLVRNNTLQWRDEDLVSLNTTEPNEEESDHNNNNNCKPLQLGVKYNWVLSSQDEEFSKMALPINIEQKRNEEEIKPLIKGHIVVDWEWLELLLDEFDIDVYFVAFVSNSPDKFIKTGLVKAQKKGKFPMNERMQLWAEGPFEEETVVVLQVYKSLGVKELIAEESIPVKKIIKDKEWVKEVVGIVEDEEEGKVKIGEVMVGVVWVKEEEKE